MRKTKLKILAWILFCIGIHCSAFSHATLVELSRNQYFENDVATVRVVLDQQIVKSNFTTLQITWSILGKELKRESWNLKKVMAGSESFFNFKLPEKVRAETPVTLTLSGRLTPEDEIETLESLTFLIYPKNADYYINPKELSGKKIALFDPRHSVYEFLKKLNLPFDSMENLDRLNYKKYDLLILSSDVSLPPVFDISIKMITIDPVNDEPLTRLYAVHLIRQSLKNEDLEENKEQ